MARNINIWCIYDFLGRDFINYAVMYDVNIQFWPTLIIYMHGHTSALTHSLCTCADLYNKAEGNALEGERAHMLEIGCFVFLTACI